MTGLHGHPPSSRRLLSASAGRRLRLVVQRVRWSGRGWPARVLIEGRLKVTGPGTVRLGVGVRLNDSVWLHVEQGGELVLGPGTAVGRFSQLAAMGTVEIGTDVLLSPGVVVMDHSHGARGNGTPFVSQPLSKRGNVVIEDGCWLGAYACVLSGKEDLVIGAGSIIGAGTVVTSSVPPGTLLVGPVARAARRSTETVGPDALDVET